MMLVIDNVEQVIDAASHLAALVASVPGVKLLVTSRERLHVTAERQFEVQPLEMPSTGQLPPLDMLAHYGAVALFLERARAARASCSTCGARS